jgi:cytochrome c biogenesis protein CcmG/thiol:disulfide interchange protein DsbE
MVVALGLGTSLVSCGDDDAAPDDVAGESTAGPDGTSLVDDTSVSEASITVEGDPLPEFADDGDDPAVGMAAPSLSGTDYDGQAVAFTPGEADTLLVFLAHWCPHCNAEIPMMLEWQEAGGLPDDLDVIGVSTGVDQNRPNYPPGEWLADKEWAWPVIADDEGSTAALAYGLSGFPYMVLVDSDGNVVARVDGEQQPEQLAELVGQVSTA